MEKKAKRKKILIKRINKVNRKLKQKMKRIRNRFQNKKKRRQL